MPVTELNQLDPQDYYTYADYLTWQFRERVELILGKIFPMSPAPGSQHQHVVLSLSINLQLQLKQKGNPCMIFPAPFDVIFPNPEGNSNTILQPDITVVCDHSKIRKQGCVGVPDLVVEVVSPGSARHDLRTKFKTYESHRVQEYWIVYPLEQNLIVYTLNNEGKYQASIPVTIGDPINSNLFPDLNLDLGDVFKNVVYEPEPPYADLVRI